MKDSSVIIIISIIAITLMLTIINGCNQTEKTARLFIEKGYIQEQKIGETGKVWTKPAKNTTKEAK